LDIVDKKTRSRMMSQVKGKNTKLEIVLRKRLFALGFRYLLHPKNLPGKPDLILKKYRTAVFFNGCFWHLHGCEFSGIPKTRSSWWSKKLNENRERDRKNLEMLKSIGWRIIIIWECSIKKSNRIERKNKLVKISFLMRDFILSKRKFMELSAYEKNILSNTIKVHPHER
jgi:DNA mismatch endonuclease, patch repair protein